MPPFIAQLRKIISGDVVVDEKTLSTYSHDTSLFEVRPQAVIFPKNDEDVAALVKWVATNKSKYPDLSITARSGGTDMSGGAINDSIILGFEKYLNVIGPVRGDQISVQPGAWYRDFEVETLKNDLIMPAYPASRDLCAVGGMAANNAGGEKSLVYGKVENFVKQLKVVLRDGKEYTFGPLDKQQLEKKLAQKDFEGNIYRQVHSLLNKHYDAIKAAKPSVTKNSTGYKLWDIWDKEKETFDLSQLIIGSQGTLGIITDITFRLVHSPKHSGVLVGYARNLDKMGKTIATLRKHQPTAIEAFDEHTLRFAFRFFLQFRQGIGWFGLFRLAISLIPDAFILLRGTPKIIFIASFEDDDQTVITNKILALQKELDSKNWGMITERAETEAKSERFWMMRRKSFKLLRDNVKGNLHTAPFIDDVVVPPEHVQAFWPKIKKILKKYNLNYTIAGHLGDGNFHIIPLMDVSKESERAKIEPCLRDVMDLIKQFGGVISGEHNDGLIRSPFLEKMYGEDIFKLFKEVKGVFDPQGIFNPHKKTDADWEFSEKHIREHF